MPIPILFTCETPLSILENILAKSFIFPGIILSSFSNSSNFINEEGASTYLK